MKSFTTLRVALVLLAGTAIATTGCSSSGGGDDGTGGSSSGTGGTGTGTGGLTGTGGSSTGGTPGTGGMTATGGRPGTGGATGTGGVIGTGGVTGTGGATGTGGTAGAGGKGSGGIGGGAAGGRPGTGGTAGGASGGSTGAGGAGSFEPCPTDGTPCKILPFGDSITYGLITKTSDQASSDPSINGKDSHGGYRVELFKKAVTASQSITFLGSLSNGPTTVDNMPFPPKNEGHSGWTILPIGSGGGVSGISTLIPSPAFTAIPDIVLLHIGTNDALKISASQMATNLKTLIGDIFSAAPSVLLVVAKIIPLQAQQSTADSYNSMIPTVVQGFTDMGKHVIIVDMSAKGGFDTSTMLAGDDVHPNQAGYDFMGDTWYAAISSYLH